MKPTPLPNSSFFKRQGAPKLPSPAEVRALNNATGHWRATQLDSPTPLKIPSLGLLIKYGASITRAEVETQIFLYKQLRNHHIPIPEVFGHAEDNDQRFIYMALMPGDTLQERFAKLTAMELRALCAELRGMVKTWHSILKQNEADVYIGTLTLCTQFLCFFSSSSHDNWRPFAPHFDVVLV